MSKSKAWRIGGFIAALTASAGLVATATGATGAYFTDTHPGSFTANSGHLTLAIAGVSGDAAASGTDNLTLNFKDLYPGDYQTENINYKTDSSVGNEDLWLVFPTTTTDEQNAFAMFTGPSTSYNGGGLGRYGHFAVSDTNGGLAFSSYNLAGPGTCTDSYGRGTAAPGTTPGDNAGAVQCAVPQQILLASNLASGSTGTVSLTFGLTGRQQIQNQVEFQGLAVDYQIVATQPGIRP